MFPRAQVVFFCARSVGKLPTVLHARNIDHHVINRVVSTDPCVNSLKMRIGYQRKWCCEVGHLFLLGRQVLWQYQMLRVLVYHDIERRYAHEEQEQELVKFSVEWNNSPISIRAIWVRIVCWSTWRFSASALHDNKNSVVRISCRIWVLIVIGECVKLHDTH